MIKQTMYIILSIIMILSWGIITSTVTATEQHRLLNTNCLVDNEPVNVTVSNIYLATSLDGVVFEANDNPILNQAHTPDAVHHNGQTLLYYVSQASNEAGIWVAQHHNGQFTTADCLKFDGNINPQAVTPDVVALNEGGYRLFYVDSTTPNQVMTAISADGINFTSPQIALQSNQPTNPTVIQFDNGTWLLAYNQGSTISFANSTTGEDFSPLNNTVVGSESPELVTLPNGEARLLLGQTMLSSYYSIDSGVTWQAEQPSATILNQTTETNEANHPSAIYLTDGRWELFYTVMSETNQLSMVNGTILLQSRESHAGVDIYLTPNDCTTLASHTPITTTDITGKFEFSIEANQIYHCIQAKKAGFLTGQYNTLTGDVGTLTLLGGDVNGDNEINVFDLALIAANYDGNIVELDLNGDGLVDIFDLTLTAINYNKRGPIK